MASNFLEQIDGLLEHFFAGWNVLSTVIVVLTVALVFYPIFFSTEPDIHPFLLGRQSNATLVRQPGESAVYRGSDVPHGYPLRSGLNVKDEGAPMYVAGRDGDLRDIWHKAVKAAPTGQKLITVRGKDISARVSFEDLSKDLDAIGQHLQAKGASRVAICLHNCTEFITALFSAAFYGFTPVFISATRWSSEELEGIIKSARADSIIAPAGLFPPSFAEDAGYKSVIWVVEPNSRHLDFGADDSENSFQWHDLTAKAVSAEKRPKEPPSGLSRVVMVHPKSSNAGFSESFFVEYTHANIVAAVGAQLSVQPRNHTMQPSDILLSLDSLADMYPLVVTLAGVWSGSSVALLSAAGGRKVDFDLAFAVKELNPSIIIAASATMVQARVNRVAGAQDLISSFRRNSHARNLAAGAMTLVDKVPNRPFSRLVYVPETPSWRDSVPLNGAELTDLRILTRSRVVYALVVPEVAGAVAQTHMFDYRNDPSSAKRSHFGPPMGSLELKVVDTPSLKITDDQVKGEIVVTGPSVTTGELRTGITGQINADGTVSLA